MNKYEDFEKIYEQRPCKENIGGLNFYGMYSLWNILNMLKPKYVIESGVWKGCSTWIIDNVDSVEKIICIDPLNENWYPDNLSYLSKKAEYTTVDFLKQKFESLNLIAKSPPKRVEIKVAIDNKIIVNIFVYSTIQRTGNQGCF